MFLTAFGLVATLACLMLFMVSVERRWKLPSLKHVPAICGMCVGWAFGNASVRLLEQIDQDSLQAVSIRFCVECNYVHLSFSFALTFVSAMLILWMRPVTRYAATVRREGVGVFVREFGGGGGGGGGRSSLKLATLKGLLKAWGATSAELLTKAISYNVMFTWGFTSDHLILWGVSSEQNGTPLLWRTLFLYAIAVGVGGSYFTVKTSKWRTWLARRHTHVRRELLRETPQTLRCGGVGGGGSSNNGGGGNDGSSTTPLRIADAAAVGSCCTPSASSETPTPLGLLSPHPGLHHMANARGVAAALTRIDRKLGRRIWLAQCLVLFEQTFAWVAGVAFTEAVEEFTTQADYPTPYVVVSDLLYAISFTVFGLLLFAVTGKGTEIEESRKGSREAVESYFAMYALSFIMGWGWIIAFRDIETIFADAVSQDGRYGRLKAPSEALIVAVFGPGLFILLTKTKRASFSTFCCSPAALKPITRQHEVLRETATADMGRTGGEADEELSASVRQLVTCLKGGDGACSSASATSHMEGGGGVRGASVNRELASAGMTSPTREGTALSQDLLSGGTV